jgi:hypothetical protein
MSTTKTAAAPTTQKTGRKAAAAVANDEKFFQQTKFGRRRISSLRERVLRGCVMLVGLPFFYILDSMRHPKRPSG